MANRAHWARNYLSQAGLVEAIKRGHYRITAAGTELLESGIEALSKEDLRRYPPFEQFLERSKSGGGTRASSVAEVGVPGATNDLTPEDRLLSAAAEIESALAGDVLAAVLSLSPARFEQLVLDLLLAMGYGDGDLGRGLRTSLSGDGGIDGIINDDELGLDAVYVQAKRYAPENNVGRPALNAFVGSLTGEGAGKGVFVTTSDFSREARDYVTKVQHRIVLINGDRLARLMIKHDVGVRARRTYVLRSVDEDYFSDT